MACPAVRTAVRSGALASPVQGPVPALLEEGAGARGPGAQEAEQDGGVRVGPGRRAPRGEGRQRVVSLGPSVCLGRSVG